MEKQWKRADERFTLAHVKAIDIVEYLLASGYEPVKIHNADHWFLSPLRNEKTASFKVNQRLNRWFDHGIGKGGNLVDLIIAMHGCSAKEVLQLAQNQFVHQKPIVHKQKSSDVQPDNQIHIVDVKAITSPQLKWYLDQRRIPLHIARDHCKEVKYKLGDRLYFAIGFQNDSGGFELRNSFTKLSSSPKDISTMKTGSKALSVFEGFFDFLSYKTIQLRLGVEPEDCLVLNSLSMFEKARPIMEQHDHVNLYLDNDAPGKKCTQDALQSCEKYKDARHQYEGFKDLNDWLIDASDLGGLLQRRKSQNQSLQP